MTPASCPPPLPLDSGGCGSGGGGGGCDASSEDTARENALRRLGAHYGEGDEGAAQGAEGKGDAGVPQPSWFSSATARRPRHPHLSLWFLWVADPGWRVLVGAHVESELPACGANAALGRAAAGGGASPPLQAPSPPPPPHRPPPRRRLQHAPRRGSAGIRAARCCGGGVPASPRGPAAVCLTPAGVAMHTRRHVLADWGCQFFARFLGVKQAVLRVALKYGRFVEERADGAAEALCPYVRRRRAAAAAAADADDAGAAAASPPPVAARRLDEGSGGVRPLTVLEEYCLENPQDSCRWISQRAAAERRQRQQKRAAAETAIAAAEGFLRATAKAASSVGRSPVFTGPCAGWLRSRAERHYRTLQGSGQHDGGGGGGGVGAAVDASLFTVLLHRLYTLFFWFSRGRSCREGFAASAAPETQADFWATAASDSAAMARLGARKLLEVDVRKPFPQVIQARNRSWSAGGAGGGASGGSGGRHVISQSVFVAWYLTWAGVVLTTAENPLECQHLDAFFDTFVLADVVNSPPPPPPPAPEAAATEATATPLQPALPPAATVGETAATPAAAATAADDEKETEVGTPPPATPSPPPPPPLPLLLHPSRSSIVVPVCGGEQPQPRAAAAAAAAASLDDADAVVVTIISKADAAAEAVTAAPVSCPRPPTRSQAGGGEPPPDEELDDQARQVCGVVRRTLLRDRAFVRTTDGDAACVDTAMVRSILRNVGEGLDHERAWGRAVQSRVARAAACAGGAGCCPPSKARTHAARSHARGPSRRALLRHEAGASSLPAATAAAAAAAVAAIVTGAAAARRTKSHDWLSEGWADGGDGAAFCTSLSASGGGGPPLPPPPKAAAAACAAALCAVGAALVAARDSGVATYGVIKAAVRLKRRSTATHAKKKKDKSPSLGDFFRIYRERLKGSGYTEAAQVLGLTEEGRGGQDEGAAGHSVSVDGQQLERRATTEGERRDEKFLCVA